MSNGNFKRNRSINYSLYHQNFRNYINNNLCLLQNFIVNNNIINWVIKRNCHSTSVFNHLKLKLLVADMLNFSEIELYVATQIQKHRKKMIWVFLEAPKLLPPLNRRRDIFMPLFNIQCSLVIDMKMIINPQLAS